MNVAILVPRRSDGGRRDELWEFCRTWWEQCGWPIIEGDHTEGKFNRGAAINNAAKQAPDADVYLIVDGDVLIHEEYVREAVQLAHGTKSMVFPYATYKALNQQMSNLVLDGYSGSWEPGVELRMTKHVSSVQAIPRTAFERLSGFDERFIGWGWDDLAFYHAAAKTCGVRNLDGTVWHLWHPTAPENEKGAATYRSTPDYLAGQLLAERYAETADIDRLLQENRENDQICAVILTTGTRDTLVRTVASHDEMVSGPIGRRILIVDGPTKPHFDGWEVINIRANGYGPAMRQATRIAASSGQPWVFWCEDDFTFDEPVNLGEMQAEMQAFPDLAQLALPRQPFFKNELEAGGVFEAISVEPEPRGNHAAHRAYWTSNPHLTRRTLMAANPWPRGKWSETQFGELILSDQDARMGVWQGRQMVTHTGTKRVGRGY